MWTPRLITRGLAAAKGALIRQVSRPVLWEESVRAMIDGRGLALRRSRARAAILSGLLVRIDKGAGRVSVQGPSDFAAAKEAIAEVRGEPDFAVIPGP